VKGCSQIDSILTTVYKRLGEKRRETSRTAIEVTDRAVAERAYVERLYSEKRI
jgi:hypothetical protein